ncbi:hypothetical protein A3F29_00110 [Candidatus Roizmanbacteria bacterium RIFCSPHIGHO2_12_FULL_33_9]|uniref:Uncharacterized protein n=1 Tax=Candidatus Roizmanbacteria bacterium RIFCSPHIGHO2_12_FULL_33_9 TaxID=1802045 RepID=A0A1F7HFW8_9BACT|nr:MAG: hypothetical protein A3F29_00110 [Candidatus Roizmanbacteria bacterium RIFCSPHIGHO2_12_FULL_33_9]
MLTSRDLNKIDKLITKRTEEVVERVVNRRVKIIVKKEIKTLDNKIIRKINLLISYFENEFLPLEKRVTRVEKHLNLN